MTKLRGATPEQVEPIKAAVRLIQHESKDWPLVNALYVLITHLEPGLQPDEIAWVISLMLIEIESASRRGEDDIVRRLHSVVDSLCDVQSDLQATGVRL